MATFIMIIGSAFVRIFNETTVINKIMNQLYSFQQIEKNKKKNKKNKRWKFLKTKKSLRKTDSEINPTTVNSAKINTSDLNIADEGKLHIVLEDSHPLRRISQCKNVTLQMKTQRRTK